MGSWTIVFLLVNFLILECQSQCWSYDSALMTHVLISGSSSCLTVQPIPNNLKNLKAFKLDLRMNATLIAFMDRLPATIEVLDLGGNLISNVPANFFQKFGGSLKKLYGFFCLNRGNLISEFCIFTGRYGEIRF
jgi:hypothetical protein